MSRDILFDHGNARFSYRISALIVQNGRALLQCPVGTQDYAFIGALADLLAGVQLQDPVILCMEQDMAKALGQTLALRLGPDRGILCIDRVRLTEGSYLDVGAPIGPALPVVVKTIVFSN